ncbi:MAG: DUF883 family protein [Deltaproteobacteria bacterium]|nr:DUF883 family protein [Deltaproteobacteria bacterium]
MNKTGMTGGGTAEPGTFDSRLDSIKDSVKGLVDSGSEKATALKDKLADVKTTAVDRGQAALTNTSRLIKEHPFAAIGIAFGVGYLAMRIVRR